ncbi:hypothetical protein J3E69DRAFT_188270 [Trichoderma sp. SZMC 28015]
MMYPPLQSTQLNLHRYLLVQSPPSSESSSTINHGFMNPKITPRTPGITQLPTPPHTTPVPASSTPRPALSINIQMLISSFPFATITCHQPHFSPKDTRQPTFPSSDLVKQSQPNEPNATVSSTLLLRARRYRSRPVSVSVSALFCVCSLLYTLHKTEQAPPDSSNSLHLGPSI